MLKQRLHNIKTAILEYNPYFNDGFDDVYADDKGIRQGEKVLFPNDTLGDYFYIRLNNGIRMQRGTAITDCAVPTDLTMTGVIVACVKNANADQLIENIVNTLMWNNVLPTGANWNKEEVIREQMRSMPKEDITAALARVGGKTIVSVSFEYRGNVSLTKLSCMQNPCECSG